MTISPDLAAFVPNGAKVRQWTLDGELVDSPANPPEPKKEEDPWGKTIPKNQLPMDLGDSK